MIKDWKQKLIAIPMELTATDILGILEGLVKDEASEIIIEFLVNHPKAKEAVIKWLAEEQ